MKRRLFLSAGVAAGASLFSLTAQASTYPSRPIRWVVPFAAGGPADVITRKLAHIAEPKIGQTIIVENKAGANGAIGTADVARAAPDGYTFGAAVSDSLTSVASLVKNPGYDARTDLTLLLKFSQAASVMLVSKQSGFKSLQELLAGARQRPASIAYATWGPGTGPQLRMRAIEEATGTAFLAVPYRGLAPALQDVAGGNVQIVFVPANIGMQWEERGTALAIAALGTERTQFMPNVPTFDELGISHNVLKMYQWHAMVAPKGLPPELVKRWVDVLIESVRSPEFTAFLPTAGQTLHLEHGEEFAHKLSTEWSFTNGLIRSLGVSPI